MSAKEKLPTNLLQIFCRTFLTSQVIIKIIKSPKTICRGTPKHERVKSILGEIFEGEMFVRKLSTNLLQIFCRTFLTSQVIIKIIKNPKTICRGTPKHERVKSIFGELFEGEIFVRKLSTNLLQIFCLPKLLSIQSCIQMTISRGTPNM